MQKKRRILGISPGTRVMGIALAEGDAILEWRLKAFKGKWSPEKLELILDTIDYLILTYNINTVAIKFPQPVRRTEAVKELCREIKKMAKKRCIKLYEYNYEDLRNSPYSPKHTKKVEMQKLNEAAACALKVKDEK